MQVISSVEIVRNEKCGDVVVEVLVKEDGLMTPTYSPTTEGRSINTAPLALTPHEMGRGTA